MGKQALRSRVDGAGRDVVRFLGIRKCKIVHSTSASYLEQLHLVMDYTSASCMDDSGFTKA